MTVVELNLTDEDKRALSERAAAEGGDLSAYVERLVRLDLHKPTWAEIFRPMQEACAGHGMSDQELDAFLEGELQGAREDRDRAESR